VGRIQDAIPHFENLVKRIDSEPLDTSDPDTRTNLNNLAVAYFHMGLIHEAIPLFEKTLALNRTRWGPGNSETLTTMHNLASAYRNADRLADAIALYEEALRISRDRLGPEHPDTFRSVCALAQAYIGDARPHDAVAILEPAKTLATSKLGADHPHTIQITIDLAETYRVLGRPSEAIPLMEEALRLTRIRHGPDHKRTLVAMTNLAGMYRGAGRSNEEVLILEDALARWRRVDPDSPDFAPTLFNFGTTLSGQMEHDRAEHAFREVLVILEKNRPDYWLRFSAQIKLGQLLVKQDKYDEAEPLLLAGYEGLQAQPKLRQAAQLHVTEAVQGLVKLYEATDRHEKAAEWRGKDAPPDS
jgi:tetratricopeptide (TPR) repeat protein